MKLIDLTIEELKEKLGKERSTVISDHELLAIRLRQKIYWPDDDFIAGHSLRAATSASMAADGRKVCWLLLGGLLEGKFAADGKKFSGGAFGFSCKALVDFFCLHPYRLDIAESPEKLLKEHSSELPLQADYARELQPGTTFQLMGQGQANLSAGLKLRKGLAAVGLDVAASVQGHYSLRLFHVINVKSSHAETAFFCGFQDSLHRY